MNKWAEKIKAEAKRLDWPELYEATQEVISDTKEANYRVGYLMRLYYRASKWSQKCDFGKIRIARRDGHDFIMFYNYTYAQYLWANKHDYLDWLDNNYFLVPYEKFPKETLKKLQEKAVNSYAA